MADTPRGLQTFQPVAKSEKTGSRRFAPTDAALNATPPVKSERNLEIRRNIYDQSGKDLTANIKEKQTNGEDTGINGGASGETAIKAIEEAAKEPKKPINCCSCGIDCIRVRFHYAKTTPTTSGAAAPKKYDFCPACFENHRYPHSMNAVDFLKLEDKEYSAVKDRDAPWTDTELLLLLEGLEQFDENWNSVADHVGTRTREECVVKFLQLEIEDKYLEGEINGQQSYGTLDRGRIPFSQADNPVLSVVAFLASLNEPSVAAAAAGRSVDEMRKLVRERIENGQGGEPEKQSKEKEAMKSEDSMEIDEAQGSPANATDQASGAEDQEKQTSSLPAIAFAAAAARAAALASNEEREMTRLVGGVLNTMLQKLESKLQRFNELDTMLQNDRRELERGRQQLFLDRIAFRRRVAETQEAFRTASLKGGDAVLKITQGAGSAAERLAFQPRAGDKGSGAVGPLNPGSTGYHTHEI